MMEAPIIIFINSLSPRNGINKKDVSISKKRKTIPAEFGMGADS